jgi:catechol 2,3-dioxygenase-like lactoylglutathione lyase family enzyme
VDYKLELIVIPVNDMDRAKAFYGERAGFHVDVDHRAGEDFRVGSGPRAARLRLVRLVQRSRRQRLAAAGGQALRRHESATVVEQ